MSITTNWREASRDAHRAIETTALSRALIKSEIDRSTYCSLLVQLHAIHAAWEAAMVATDSLGVFEPAMQRTAEIAADLRALGEEPTDVMISGATREFVAEIERLRRDCPAALAGVLYVLEGSRMGSMVLAPRIAAALNLTMRPGVGLDYHIVGLRDVPGRWGATKARLDGALHEHPDAAAAGLAVADTFARMHAVYDACMADPAASVSA